MFSQGTRSVLFGCHSIVHSIIVIIAWKKVYWKLPNWREVICILLHDIGHWGYNYLDNYEEKKIHGRLGARIALRLFGRKGYTLIAGHNTYMGFRRSRLFLPDKYSWVIAPTIWLVSNQLFEPKLKRRGSTMWESARMFKKAMKSNMAEDFPKLGHEIYLEQWGYHDSNL